MATTGTSDEHWGPEAVLEVLQEEAPDGTAVCRLQGDLDTYTAPRLRQALAALASAPRLVVDLSDVAFIDSAGLGALVGGIRRAQDAGGATAVVCRRPALVRLLEMTGFERLAPVAPTLDEALASLSRPDDGPAARHRTTQGHSALLA
ncbi:MAG TPA: STAS domain-containing protein [Acidimicrobiales bacterium]|nr:STAS domain-containing protein [Acidimicrobiales bacterium]